MRCLSLLALLVGLAHSANAFALQPLDEFITTADARNFERREANAVGAQRDAEADGATARLFPTLSARAAYTRNQFEVSPAFPGAPGEPPTTVAITPLNQYDALFQATMPIIDVGAWTRVRAARAAADAATLRASATASDVEKAVTRLYFQVLATDASIGAAKDALEVAQENQNVIGDRRAAGTASELDAERARAQVERAKQALAVAEQQRGVARRQLETVSGLTPSEDAGSLQQDGLGEPFSSDVQVESVDSLPSVRAASADYKAAAHTATSAWLALAPSINAQATERLSNATGFTGRTSVWTVMLQTQWVIDPSAWFSARAMDRARDAAAIRAERAKRLAEDALFIDTEEVRAQIARVTAATAEVDASVKAAKLARDRYAAGSVTQLDVQQADRDVLAAQLARIQAMADLGYARALLKIDSGHGVLARKEGRR
jgi:outer membrane protein TolC